MKAFIIVLAFMSTSTAFGKQGVSMALETNTDYRYVGTTEQQQGLDAGLGFVKVDHDYGMHLSLGPTLYSDQYSSITVTYGAGFLVRGQGAAMYHEAAGNLRLWVFGASVGHSWEHHANLSCPQGSGLGNRNFGRLSITFEGN